jgi:hypothetical protein
MLGNLPDGATDDASLDGKMSEHLWAIHSTFAYSGR